MSDTVIHMEGVKKVFLTDEVETHALAGIDRHRVDPGARG